MKTVFLPFEEAVKAAIAQNIDRDIRLELLDDDDLADQGFMAIYEEEAREILTETGENYLPDFPDHSLIRVKD